MVVNKNPELQEEIAVEQRRSTEEIRPLPDATVIGLEYVST